MFTVFTSLRTIGPNGRIEYNVQDGEVVSLILRVGDASFLCNLGDNRIQAALVQSGQMQIMSNILDDELINYRITTPRYYNSTNLHLEKQRIYQQQTIDGKVLRVVEATAATGLTLAPYGVSSELCGDTFHRGLGTAPTQDAVFRAVKGMDAR